MKALLVIFCVALALLATGCEQETRDVAVVQQLGQFRPVWDDVIYVYGFADNYSEAKVIADHYSNIYAPRTYRIKTATIPLRDYERQQKQLTTQ